MKKTLLFLFLTFIGTMVSNANCGNNPITNAQDKTNCVCNAINFVNTWWIYEDGNGTGILFHFVSDNWVQYYSFSRNENPVSEWDSYYKLDDQELCTFQMDQPGGNTGTIWEVDGDRREVLGTFVISGNTMGFTNKKRTMSWTLQKTEAIPDCIH